MSGSIQTRENDSVKRLILAALLAGAAIPASAQYYGPGYGPPPPPPGYGPSPDYGPPPRPYGYGPRPDGYGPRPYGRQSSVCVTSRGTCPIGYAVPFNSPCRCDIPGFGPKRGASR